ncbi:MAG: right-handed parallel beta-helix repeat-containing protein [Thermoleophilia bacterium]|nr:right-handed parallel beta-helix repeat-containing protein [Thermoleophilia bacterium]
MNGRALIRAAGVPAFVALALAACGASPTPAHADVSCTRYASASGSDGASGSASSPYRTAQRLQDSLRPGDVGCLAPGQTFSGRLRGNTSGTPGNPIVMTSGPGAGRATIVGEIYLPADSHDVTYRNLNLNGQSSFRVSPNILGDRISFLSNDVTDNHHAICFHLGKVGEGVAENTVIDGNRIHDCGRLPATGLDHGIYVETARNTRITNNYIYDNADYGIQLYPDAQGTYVANNVIDGNGRGITVSGENGYASSNNTIVNNTISNSTDTSNLETYWGSGQGSGNKAQGNCLWNARKGNVGESSGLSVSGSIIQNPQYVDRGAKNFAMSPGSPCAGKGPAADSAAPPSPGSSSSAAPPPSVAVLVAAPSSVARSAAPSKRTKRAVVRAAAVKVRWLKRRRAFVVTTRPFAGRVSIVARAGGRIVGNCRRRFTRPRPAACYIEVSTRSAAAAGRVRIHATLPLRRGRVQRVTLTRAIPAMPRGAGALRLTGTGPDSIPR